MTTSLLRIDELSNADHDAWRGLAARAAEPNPFFEPEALLPAWRHLPADRVRLLVVSGADGWHAAVPVERRARYGKLPGPCWLVWEHAHCAVGTPLVAADRLEEAADALAGALIGRRADAWTGFRALGDDGPVSAALRSAIARRGRRPIVIDHHDRAALLTLEGDVGTAALKSDTRRRLTKRERGLAKAGGGPVELAEAAGEDAVERFLTLEHAGWKGAEGTSLLGAPGHAAFFRELCRNLADEDRVRFFELRAGDRIAAIQCTLRADGTEYFFKTAYDEALGSFGPGVLAAAKAIDVVGATPGVARVDGCSSPRNDVLNRMMPGRLAIATLAVPSAGPAGRVAGAVLPAALRLRDRLRRPRASG